MRVVAGKYRAKKLNEFSLGSTRPTLDRVKEAIFSSVPQISAIPELSEVIFTSVPFVKR